MLEIRFHGRGGQGTVVASILMANAFFEAGYTVQSFPLFGVERRGAPVEAYLRLDKGEIYIRTNVYEPDHVVVLDPSMITSIDVTKGLKKRGWILLNAQALPRDTSRWHDFKIAWVDAAGIALNNRLGSRTHPIVNTAMMGAFARVLGMPSIPHIERAIKKEVPGYIENNINAAKEAFNAVNFHTNSEV